MSTSLVLRGDARHLPIADSSVDLVCTSPPYFGLRSYTDGGEHYAGQVGSEATPAEFVDALIAVTAECVRVLKPSGSIWVNLGDKYAGSANGKPHTGSAMLTSVKRATRSTGTGRSPETDVRPKSLIGIPWRYALRCIDDLGLILRAEVIWSKPNGLPESVTDRVRRSHETWFHFTREPRYFSAVDEIREPAEQARPQAARALALATRAGLTDAHRDALLARGLGDQGRSAATQTGTGKNTAEVLRLAAEADAALGSYTREFTMTSQSLGKLPGSVWTVPTAPLTVPDHLGVDHFAAFPPEFPRRIILGWSPAGVCTVCGQGRRPVVDRSEKEITRPRGWAHVGGAFDDRAPGKERSDIGSVNTLHRITGYACDCLIPDAPTRSAVVLDPFSGTGTTAMVARALGRIGIGVDLSADYCRLGQWRTNDLAQHAKVRGEDFRRPEPQIVGQLGMFGGAA